MVGYINGEYQGCGCRIEPCCRARLVADGGMPDASWLMCYMNGLGKIFIPLAIACFL